MDPIAQLGHAAYHALCVAFAAQHKDKLYAPETDVLLEEARELLGISEDDDAEIRDQIEKDPMIAALRRGELPPGGVRLPAAPAARPAGFGGASMPPPSAPAAVAATAYETPFSAPAQQSQKATSKKAAAPPPAALPPATAPAAGSTGYVGRMLKRLFPDLSPPWVTGTIVQYNPANGKHLISYGAPLKKELWDCIEEFAPQNFQWVEPGSEPAVPTTSKAGGASKSGAASKAAPKAVTPKAPPPPPPAPKPIVPVAPVAAPLLALPGGPSTFHSTGVSLTAAPYSDGFLKSCLAKNRPEDLCTMLSSLDDREMAVARELIALVEDPGDAAELNRLFQESQQLGQREQQLRAELRELGVMG
ncbi:hypothetical protein GPECTOR_6g815 [Gonium pectorale]|uniref:ENT domain-containing protein n=1 Tax=Gonium pectorale TaxID=33097 RepID=A0A150GVI3_GONPE|nr:hypothetical protein GPECTOR_6g815 [Gonium pectorale]|eukprot:KXZ53897.1 hypothetical protein GPECTOR_6g815 [Gonium pectorale]